MSTQGFRAESKRVPRPRWVRVFGVVALASIGLWGCTGTSHRSAPLPGPAPTPSAPSTSKPAPTTSQPLPTTTQPAPPAHIRAAFYYPWFPEAWVQQGQSPFTNFTPARGLYRTDVATVRAQIVDMQFGGITIGIASWFGPGTVTDSHWPALISAARGGDFRWAPYYEPEGLSDPTPSHIAADMHYLRSRYGGGSAGSVLASLGSRGMPVFVYNADDLTQAKGCDTVARWTKARELARNRYGETIYVDLKVFPGYTTCPGASAIDGWHQYEPARSRQNFAAAPGDGSYTISPGYWKSGSPYRTGQFLIRNRDRWRKNIASMDASGARWQLVTTYNEWGEGTAIESAEGCRSPVPSGAYCDWSGKTQSDFLTDLHMAPPN
ncbi:MAG: hypothetical protein QOG65_1451 [Actinomycetota bacterium]|nr:hypothetical protein [Actinomycetota bacterium]